MNNLLGSIKQGKPLKRIAGPGSSQSASSGLDPSKSASSIPETVFSSVPKTLGVKQIFEEFLAKELLEFETKVSEEINKGRTKKTDFNIQTKKEEVENLYRDDERVKSVLRGSIKEDDPKAINKSIEFLQYMNIHSTKKLNDRPEPVFKNVDIVKDVLNKINEEIRRNIGDIVESMFEPLVQMSTVKKEDEIDILFKTINENLEKRNEKGNLFINNTVYKIYISGLLEDYKLQFEELKKLESLKKEKEIEKNTNLNINEIDSVRINIVSALKQIEKQLIQYKKKPLPVFLGKPETIEIKKKEQEKLDKDLDEQIFYSVNDNNGFITPFLNKNLELFIEKIVNDDEAKTILNEIIKNTTTDLSKKSKDELITFIKGDEKLKKEIRNQMDSDKLKNHLKKYLKHEIATFVTLENKKYFTNNGNYIENIKLKLSDENIEKLVNEAKAKKQKEAEEAKLLAEKQERTKQQQQQEEARKKEISDKTYSGFIEKIDGNKKIVNITSPTGKTIKKIVDCIGNVCTVTEDQNIPKEVSSSNSIVSNPMLDKYQKQVNVGALLQGVLASMRREKSTNGLTDKDIEEFENKNTKTGGRRKTKKAKKTKKARKQNKSKKNKSKK